MNPRTQLALFVVTPICAIILQVILGFVCEFSRFWMVNMVITASAGACTLVLAPVIRERRERRQRLDAMRRENESLEAILRELDREHPPKP